MSEQPSPQETQRNRRVNDQGQYFPPQQQQSNRPAPAQNPQGQNRQAPRYPQGQQGRPAQRPQQQGQYRQPRQNPQGAYQQAPQQPRYPQGGQRPHNPYPPQGQAPYQQAPKRPTPSSASTDDSGAVMGKVGTFIAGFFKVLAYPFVKIAQLIGRVLTIILEEMVRTVISFIMGLALFAVLVAIIVGYGMALVNVEFNFVEAVPEMFRLFSELIGLG